MIIYNKGKRPFQNIYDGLNLEPGRSIEVPEKVGKMLCKSYPKNITDMEPKSIKKRSAAQKKKAEELKKWEADLAEREKALEAKPKKKATTKKTADPEGEATPWEDEEK